MTKKDWLIIFLLLVVAGFLRFKNLAGKMPFGWDQERDITAVTDMIKTRRPKLIGPIVRGEGGFMLGPLYYYVLLPLVFITKGNPLSLGLTSVGLDLMTLIYLYFFTRTYFSSQTAFWAASLWALSPFIINISLTSWNVSLIPLFILAVSHLSFLIIQSQSCLAPYLLAFLAGLAFHIHSSLFLLVPLLIVLILKKKFFFHLNWLYLFLAILLPFLPLLIFDLRHQFLNFHLLLKFFHTSATVKPESYFFVLREIFRKLALYFSAIFLSKPHLLLDLSFLVFAFCYSFFFRSQFFFKLFLFYLFYLILLLLIYRNPFFPEYYFNLLLIPNIILFATFIDRIPASSLLFLLLTFHFSLNYNFSSAPASLAVKQAVVQRLAQLSKHLDLRYELGPGEDSGFRYLFCYSHFQLDHNSPYKAILQSDTLPPSRINGAKYLFTDHFGLYRLSTFVVE